MSSLTGAFNIGVAGMTAFSNAISSISQNISNTRTAGYRRTEADFSTVLGGTSLGGASAGGGVQAKARTLVDVQGQIEATGRPFDVAISGKGMFVYGSEPVAGGGSLLYSRDGSLEVRLPDPASPDGFLTNSQGMFIMGWPTDDAGVPLSTGATSLVPIPGGSIPSLTSEPTSLGKLSAILPAAGTGAQTTIDYIDADGSQRSALLQWTRTASNTWQMDATLAGGTPVSSTLTFDGTGALVSAPTVDLGAFTLDVSGMGQFATEFTAIKYEKNGFATSEFQTYEIDPTGLMSARFNNGVSKPLYRLAIADFVNFNGLAEQSGNMFSPTDRSGAATYRTAEDSALTRLDVGSVERSNGDLADSFTTMIVTQRAYDGAAQIVRTVDEMTQTVRDLKR